MKNFIMYFQILLSKLEFLKIYNSPFKPIIPKVYLGKVALGVPYFYPRKFQKSTRKYVPKSLGIDIAGLGWKTKFGEYRYETNPIISFIFFKYQFAITFAPENPYRYWEAWLYYTYDTKGTISERISQCRKLFPSVRRKDTGGEIDYLKSKYKDI
jgi:hypothetical protein